MHTAIQEGVDVIGLSIMSGAHIPICRNLLQMMEEHGIGDVRVVVGGVIPSQDIPELNKMGIQGVYPGGTPFDKIAKSIKSLVK